MIFLPVLHLNLRLRILCELKVSCVITRWALASEIHLENLYLLSSRTLSLFDFYRCAGFMKYGRSFPCYFKVRKTVRDALHLSLFILYSEEIRWRFCVLFWRQKDSGLVPPRYAGSRCFAECILILEEHALQQWGRFYLYWMRHEMEKGKCPESRIFFIVQLVKQWGRFSLSDALDKESGKSWKTRFFSFFFSFQLLKHWRRFFIE